MDIATVPSTRAQTSEPVAPIGMAVLAKMAFDSVDLRPLEQSLVERFLRDAGDTAALMDLSVVKLLSGARVDGLQLQAAALQQNRIYRRRPESAKRDALRLLAF